MSINFNNAIVRLPSETIINALSSKGLSPDFLKVKIQHQAYSDTLKEIGLKVKILNPLKNFPDSLFVEDPALVFNKICIILRPGVVERSGEASNLKVDISKFFDKTYTLEQGYVEGGDILRINNHFIIGISGRTNETGAKNLSNIIEKNGGTSEIAITPENTLHFKSECSLLDEETILATDKNQSEKFLQLGANNVLTTKSLKISLPPQKTDQLYIENLRENIASKIIILAASTREGEESILINSIQKLNKKNHNVFLIIAPRHIQRANKISKINNLNIKIKSKDGLPSSYDNFWISNTYGEMSNLYSLADIVFVGGSLYPFGGHNPSEPCHYKTKIIMGPHSEKCQDIVREMKDSNALIQLNSNSEDEIINSIEKIIMNKNFSKSLSIAGSKLAKSWLKIKTNIAHKILKKFPFLVS